jgi:hypothetical protein
VKEQAPTYDQVLATARRAAQEIEQEWPAWKQALSEPERHQAPAEPGPRRDDPPRR